MDLPFNPEERADRSREHRTGALLLPPPYPFSIVASSSVGFLASAGRALVQMVDERERVGEK